MWYVPVPVYKISKTGINWQLNKNQCNQHRMFAGTLFSDTLTSYNIHYGVMSDNLSFTLTAKIYWPIRKHLWACALFNDKQTDVSKSLLMPFIFVFPKQIFKKIFFFNYPHMWTRSCALVPYILGPSFVQI